LYRFTLTKIMNSSVFSLQLKQQLVWAKDKCRPVYNACHWPERLSNKELHLTLTHPSATAKGGTWTLTDLTVGWFQNHPSVREKPREGYRAEEQHLRSSRYLQESALSNCTQDGGRSGLTTCVDFAVEI
jgi:hypothetical protein